MFNNKPPKLPPRGATSTPPERPSQPSNILNRRPPAPPQKVPDAPSQSAALSRNYSEPKDSNNGKGPYTYAEPYNSRNVSSGNNSDNKRHGRYFDDDSSAITDAQVSPLSNRGNSDYGNNNNDTSYWHLGAPRGGRY